MRCIFDVTGWEWEGAWQVDKLNGGVDSEGWSYSSDFSMLTFPPPQVSFFRNA